MLLSATLCVPAESGLLAAVTASAADMTTLQALVSSIPPESEWEVKFVKDSAFDSFKDAYHSAQNVLANPGSSEDTITLAERWLDAAFRSVKYHTLDVTVRGADVANVGDSVALTAALKPENAADSVSWSTSDESVASVSANGVVQIKKYSSSRVSVTASSNNHTSTHFIKVKNPLKSVQVSKSSQTMYPGQSVKLSYLTYGADSDASITESIDSVTWTSDFPAVASVSQDGTVTAHRQGSTTVSVEVKSGSTTVRSSCSVTVGELVKITKLEPQTVSDGGLLAPAVVDSEKKVEVKVLPSSASIKELKWTSSNPAVVSVAASGIVDSVAFATLKYLKVGTATVTYTTTDGSGLGGSFRVEVKPKITAISLSPERVVISPSAKSEKIIATLTPKDAGYQVIEWSTSSKNVCDVSSDGTLRPQNRGVCTITAKTKDGSNISKTAYVRVADTAQTIRLDQNTLNIKVSQAAALKATVVTASGSYTDDVSWSSGNTKVATVDQNGVVRGLYPGVTTIKALALDGSGTFNVCTVTVTADGNASTGFCRVELKLPDNSSLTYHTIQIYPAGTDGNPQKTEFTVIASEGYRLAIIPQWGIYAKSDDSEALIGNSTDDIKTIPNLSLTVLNSVTEESQTYNLTESEQSYTVQQDDTPSLIADLYGTTADPTEPLTTEENKSN